MFFFILEFTEVIRPLEMGIEQNLFYQKYGPAAYVKNFTLQWNLMVTLFMWNFDEPNSHHSI